MNINGFQKNKSNNNYKICCHSNNYKNNNCHSPCNTSPFDSLFQVENFLCNFRKAIKCINLYKFFK